MASHDPAPIQNTRSSGESPSAPFSAETYFATQLPPLSLDQDIAGVREFIARQTEQGRNVVLVTVRTANPDESLALVSRSSCCRAVEPRCHWSSMCEGPPLISVELKMTFNAMLSVRFLDNFSAGARVSSHWRDVT
jgi:hypothetical protein